MWTVQQRPDPFAMPLRAINSLAQFHGTPEAAAPVHLMGVATWGKPHQGFFLQSGTEGAFVESRDFPGVTPGTSMEVIGYAAMDRSSPLIHASLLRSSGAGHSVTPLHQSAGSMIAVSDGLSRRLSIRFWWRWTAS